MGAITVEQAKYDHQAHLHHVKQSHDAVLDPGLLALEINLSKYCRLIAILM